MQMCSHLYAYVLLYQNMCIWEHKSLEFLIIITIIILNSWSK